VLVKMPVLPLIDVGASFAALGEGIGRWSCFLAGDDFGRVTSSRWGIQFPSSSLAHQAHVARGLLPVEAPLSLPVHPLQFYLMANALVVFLLCSIAWYRWRQIPGRTLAVFLVLQGSTRFWWEFLRDPAGGGARELLSTSQWMCITLLCVGLGLLYYTSRRPVPPLQTAPLSS
jgi:phosphatidylglycerol:prolipoprotein diacylglycerol transferase